MAATERTYSIPLRAEVMKTPKYKRAKKAVRAVREFIAKHSKSSDVKMGKYLNLKLWERGIRNVPHMIKVDAVKDDKGTVTVELFGAPKEVKKAPEKKKAETPAEKVAEKMQAIKPGKKEGKETVTETSPATAAPEKKEEPAAAPAAKPEVKKETTTTPEKTANQQ